MCGIFGIVTSSAFPSGDLLALATYAQQRGRDSSGLMLFQDDTYSILRADSQIESLLPKAKINDPLMVIGHSRLITNGLADNQPVLRDGICVLHNGIIVNHEELWETIGKTRQMQVDTEIIPAIAALTLESGGGPYDVAARVLDMCRGVVACAMVIPHLGKLLLFSNNGSLYVGNKDGATYFSSESYPLQMVGAKKIVQIRHDALVLDVPVSGGAILVSEEVGRKTNLLPSFTHSAAEEKLLVYPRHNLRRCTKCILPETMPYIAFDDSGVCNYCANYRPRNKAKPREEIFALVEPFRRKSGNECIVPFSGGRDSCFGLHLIVKELGLRPVTYTYDWGMVTDLGRRNISRMSAELGVENIIVAADITAKRENIKKNLRAWLKSPHLGMISILTAGDKHFFRYVETIKKQTGISLNLWGINPLEVTHFKAGFLGVPPDFAEERVYQSGAMKQIRYQMLRLRAMLQSPGYFNGSLWDTLSGEYYRSFSKKSDYFHVFDYWTWEERAVDDCLKQYDWELAPDTSTTWRIGDGTAGFYNYIYYTVAGFTEHDTFRSNQIREGQITREEAITLVEEENRPRYTNIKWYLDAVGLDFSETICVVNAIPRLH